MRADLRAKTQEFQRGLENWKTDPKLAEDESFKCNLKRAVSSAGEQQLVAGVEARRRDLHGDQLAVQQARVRVPYQHVPLTCTIVLGL